MGPDTNREDRRFNVKDSNVSVILCCKGKKKRWREITGHYNVYVFKSYKITTEVTLLPPSEFKFY